MSNEVLGQLLQFYGEVTGKHTDRQKSARTIQARRSARLRDSLDNMGLKVTAETAELLADGLGSGHVSIGTTAVALQNNGSDGMDVGCGCSPPILAPFLACEMKVVAGAVWCVQPPASACPSCKLTVGLGIHGGGAIALGDDAETVGSKFLDQLPPGLRHTARTLSQLRYPVDDHLRLREQLRGLRRSPVPAFTELSFPLASEADALAKLFNRDGASLLRLAVGDYQDTTMRVLADGLASGSIGVDPGNRKVTFVARGISPGVPSAKVNCVCLGDDGECNYVLSSSGDKLTCEGADCEICEMEVTIPLRGLGLFIA
jgi:hypothetical protein